MNKKNLLLWSLYDFANSIVYITFLLYFAQWLVVDGGLSDFWYNALFAIATLLLLLSAPPLAAYVDKHGGAKFFLNWATVGTAVGYGAAALCALGSTHNVVLAALAFLVGQYFYQLSFVFYTPMLIQIAEPGRRARASGIGQFANALGQITAVLIALPLATSHAGPLLPAVLLFFVLALPMLLWFKDGRPSPVAIFPVFRSEFALSFKKLAAFLTTSAAGSFLLAYFFFNDAVITLSNNYAIVLERMFAAPDNAKSLLLLAILIMSAIGGVIAAWVAERVGVFKTLVGLLLCWVVMLPLLALAPTFAVFAVLTVPVGLLIGSSYSTARVYLTEILRPEEMNYGFSLFTLFERFASFVGPLSWGTTIALFGGGILSYRAAIGTMAVLMLVGLVILVSRKRGVNNS